MLLTWTGIRDETPNPALAGLIGRTSAAPAVAGGPVTIGNDAWLVAA